MASKKNYLKTFGKDVFIVAYQQSFQMEGSIIV